MRKKSEQPAASIRVHFVLSFFVVGWCHIYINLKNKNKTLELHFSVIYCTWNSYSQAKASLCMTPQPQGETLGSRPRQHCFTNQCSVLSLYPLVKLQKRQEKRVKWLCFAPFQSEFVIWFCLFLLLLLFACFLFHKWQRVKKGSRHTLTCSLAAVGWGISQPQFKRWSRAGMRKYDRCHYVWRLAWRGLALSPVWDTLPVPKLASHECERRPGEGAEQWGARGGGS